MPNVMGLEPAPTLFATTSDGATIAYGPHATVVRSGHVVSVLNKAGKTLARVDFTASKPRLKADLPLIDGRTITPVNAFLAPYGKVKAYWRAKPEQVPYRWHPLDGPATPPMLRPGGAASPALAPASVVEPRTTVHIVPVAGKGSGVTVEDVVPDPDEEDNAIATPVVHPVTPAVPVIETVLRWQDRRKKQPTRRVLTKTMSIVDDIVVPTVALDRFDAMKRGREAGDENFGLITGPAGTGKTAFAQAWAFSHDLPVVIVEGQSIQTASDWFGSITPTPGAASPFQWVWSDAALLILSGQPCLIVLDELNRPENERALNGVMGLLDWKAVAKPVGAPHAVRLAPGQCVVATLNEGPEYVGTVEVDAAVRDRFDGAGVRMDYVPKAAEVRILMQATKNGLDKAVAKKLVEVAAGQRAKRDDDTLFPSHNIISTRALKTIAKNIVTGGLDPVEAIWSTLTTRFSAEDEPALSVLIEAQFGANAEPVGEDEDEIEEMLAGLDA